MLGFNPLASTPLASFSSLGASLDVVAVTLVIQVTAPSISSGVSLVTPVAPNLMVLAGIPFIGASILVTIGEAKNFSLIAVTPTLNTGKSSFVPSINMQVTSPTAYLFVFNKNYNKPRTTIVMAENRLLLLTDVKRPKTAEVILPETTSSRIIILT